MYVDASYLVGGLTAVAWTLYDEKRLLTEGVEHYAATTSVMAELKGAMKALSSVSAYINSPEDKLLALHMDNQSVVYSLQRVRDGLRITTKHKEFVSLYKQAIAYLRLFSGFNIVWTRRTSKQIRYCDRTARRSLGLSA